MINSGLQAKMPDATALQVGVTTMKVLASVGLEQLAESLRPWASAISPGIQSMSNHCMVSAFDLLRYLS